MEEKTRYLCKLNQEKQASLSCRTPGKFQNWEHRWRENWPEVCMRNIRSSPFSPPQFLPTAELLFPLFPLKPYMQKGQYGTRKHWNNGTREAMDLAASNVLTWRVKWKLKMRISQSIYWIISFLAPYTPYSQHPESCPSRLSPRAGCCRVPHW